MFFRIALVCLFSACAPRPEPICETNYRQETAEGVISDATLDAAGMTKIIGAPLANAVLTLILSPDSSKAYVETSAHVDVTFFQSIYVTKQCAELTLATQEVRSIVCPTAAAYDTSGSLYLLRTDNTTGSRFFLSGATEREVATLPIFCGSELRAVDGKLTAACADALVELAPSTPALSTPFPTTTVTVSLSRLDGAVFVLTQEDDSGSYQIKRMLPAGDGTSTLDPVGSTTFPGLFAISATRVLVGNQLFSKNAGAWAAQDMGDFYTFNTPLAATEGTLLVRTTTPGEETKVPTDKGFTTTVPIAYSLGTYACDAAACNKVSDTPLGSSVFESGCTNFP